MRKVRYKKTVTVHVAAVTAVAVRTAVAETGKEVSLGALEGDRELRCGGKETATIRRSGGKEIILSTARLFHVTVNLVYLSLIFRRGGLHPPEKD